jgi:glucan phosphorylase
MQANPADPAAARGLRRGRARRSRRARRARRRWRRDPRSSSASRASSAPTRSRWRALIASGSGIKVDPGALFDVQIKRIHEYKRQLLNILETVALYQAIKADPQRDWVPRVKIFAGKAAASYATGQADHQADQRRRARSSTTTRRRAAG